MNYWLRVLWEWIVFFVWYNKTPALNIRKKMISPDFEHRYHYTCMFSNLDMNLHMNNSVYLTTLEFARSRYGMECGINGYAYKKGYGFLLAGASMQYRREVALFQTMEIRTKLVGLESKWMYFEHNCFVRGKFVARGIARLAMFDPKTKKTIDLTNIIRDMFPEDQKSAEALLEKLSNFSESKSIKSFIEHQETIKEAYVEG